MKDQNSSFTRSLDGEGQAALCGRAWVKVKAAADANFFSFRFTWQKNGVSIHYFHLIFCLKTILKVLGGNEDAKIVKILFRREQKYYRKNIILTIAEETKQTWKGWSHP